MILQKKVDYKNEADIWFPLGSCKHPYGEKMWCKLQEQRKTAGISIWWTENEEQLMKCHLVWNFSDISDMGTSRPSADIWFSCFFEHSIFSLVLQNAYRLNGGSYWQRKQNSWKRVCFSIPLSFTEIMRDS